MSVAEEVEECARHLYALAAEERICCSRVPKFLAGDLTRQRGSNADALERAAALLLRLGGADARMRAIELEQEMNG